MEEKMNSLKLFIRTLVKKNFTYEDFSPPIVVDDLRKIFKKMMSEDSPYWEQYDGTYHLQNWTLISLKSFEETYVHVGFYIREKTIEMTITEKD